MQKTQDYITNNKDRFLEELLDLLRIPSVSADSNYKNDVKKAGQFLCERLTQAGADNVKLYPTAGHPIVYGEKLIDPSKPTILVYGHYDVQPPDPMELWHSPPFEPVIKDEKIYARGACDDKGQLYMQVKAFESLVASSQLPCNVKFMIEGEEEIGSDNLGIFCNKYKDMLACDVVMISDTSMIANDTPSLTVGLRGLAYMEIEVVGPNRDLHSGTYGGAVANPINILCDIISSLHDKNRHITISGFYDEVMNYSEQDRDVLNQAPFDLKEYEQDLGLNKVLGESGYSTIERTSIRPTLDVNGIWGGYIGEGAKTVLPSKATAKVSMRLVPHQNHKTIEKLFTKHIMKIAPDYVHVQVRALHGGEAALTPTDSIEYKAAARAMEKTFGKAPIPTRGGGSIPIVSMFESTFGVKTVLMGFGLDSDNIHSPNEKFGLFNFYKGIETIPYFYQYYTEMALAK